MIEPIIGFLNRFPPFNKLDETSLATLAGQVKIRYIDIDQTIFNQNDSASPEFYVVKKGLIALHRLVEEQTELLDYCDEGDIFGVRALLGNGLYSASARSKEDSLIYVIPWDAFQRLMAVNPQLSLYLAAGFAAELPRVQRRLLAATTEAQRSFSSGLEWRGLEAEERPMIPIRDVLTCSPNTTIQAAAKHMRTRRVGSVVVVDEQRCPLGIVTDTDLRDKVVSEAVDAANTSVSAVMTTPVVCIGEPQTTSTLMGMAMQRGVHHFCFTENGTPSSPVTGVLSEHDLVIAQGNHPTALRQRIVRSRDPDELLELRNRVDRLVQSYLAQQAGMSLICSVVSGINDALIQSSIAVAREQMLEQGKDAPPEGYCWLSFGSEGREEQLLRTDLDNAIVYEDPPESRAEAVSDYYLELGRRAIDVLVHAGFERCKGNIMASNPELTIPFHAWKRKFSKLIRTPEPRALLDASIYFDFRPVGGQASLADALRQHIFAEIDTNPGFLNFLAKSALNNPPPLSFFRGFVLERSGEHASTFDIKARVMMPMVDGGRVLAYDFRLPFYGSTVGRFEKIAEAAPDLAELCSEASMAYELLLRIRAQEGFRTGDSGRYVDINRLNKLQRQSLRNTFSVVEDLQRRLSSRYRTDFIR